MKTQVLRFRLAFVGCLAACGTDSRAGTVVDEGSTALWGRPFGYRTWSVISDPTVYVGVEPVDGRPIDMAFHDGNLYVAHASLVIDAGPMVYSPGPRGDLSSASTLRYPFPGPTDPRRWMHGRSLAVNASGSGFGAFGGPGVSLAMTGPGSGGGL